ncbi:hypothetical protein GGX14DRAFT_444723 [Mycena pura]|uniref:Polysaccharide lyase 14 domain-containing protein n=1 Tax=Mycena pura TaxID=153505 RepID=A0AAD6VR76_9AGAR|nr:hypothetical protein GGX14DRAFT_444723 [Mycena pura]
MQHSHLIPGPKFQSGFTTLVLEDAVLGPPPPPPPLPSSEALESGSREPETESDLRWPAPPRAWEVFYQKGSINPRSQPTAPIPGGFGFYLAGPTPFRVAAKLSSGTGAVHVVLSYRVMLQEGWEWVKGGKLPGIFGAEGDFSYACPGGRQDDRCRWLGELYTYLPLTPSNRARLLAVPPMSKENPDYGVSVGRGAFTFTRDVGRWISLAFRVKLNAVGHEDGAFCLLSCQGFLRAGTMGRRQVLRWRTHQRRTLSDLLRTSRRLGITQGSEGLVCRRDGGIE